MTSRQQSGRGDLHRADAAPLCHIVLRACWHAGGGHDAAYADMLLWCHMRAGKIWLSGILTKHSSGHMCILCWQARLTLYIGVVVLPAAATADVKLATKCRHGFQPE